MAEFEKSDLVFKVPLDVIEPNEWNPNRQDDAVFNATVENIQETGMLQPILIVTIGDGRYRIIDGEHRYEACKLLGYETIDAIIQDFDEDVQKFQTMRFNLLKGKIDPVKFTKLFNELAGKYGEDMTKQMMMFVDEKAFEQAYLDIKKGLPKELKKKLEETKAELKTIDDLSRILNELFSKYGDTLAQNFMVFSFGGRTHLWVQMGDKLKKVLMDEVVERLKEDRSNINDFLLELMESREKVYDKIKPV